MPKTFGQLRTVIAAHMNRSVASFVVNEEDILTRAINNAKDFCQRAIDFELARVFVTVAAVDQTAGGNLDNAVLYGTATGVVVKSVEQSFLTYNGLYPVKTFSRADWIKRLQRRTGELAAVGELGIVQFGKQIYIVGDLSNSSTTLDVHFDALQWIEDFEQDADVSFLLEYCFDFLQYRSIYELNCYLKEDQRVPISKSVLDEVWNNVVQWNATIVGNTTDATLD